MNLASTLYGIVIQHSKLLLTLKESGPYKGCWDLPGGKIEFGETPEEALKREIREEAALSASKLKLLKIATHLGKYKNNEGHYQFHHIGMIYRVEEANPLSHSIPEEENCWILIQEVHLQKLTPFATQILEHLA
jgi:8-oxo-dGTP diphosphatase